MEYRNETPKSIEEAMKNHPAFATIIPEIEYYDIPQETVEILKRNSEKMIMTGTTSIVKTEKNENILLFIDIKDLDERKHYGQSLEEASAADNEKCQRWAYYKTQEIGYCKFDITPYIYINNIHEYNRYQGYNERTRTYKNKIDFSVYYTSDGRIFIPPTLAKIFKISNIDRLARELDGEKGPYFAKMHVFFKGTEY